MDRLLTYGQVHIVSLQFVIHFAGPKRKAAPSVHSRKPQVDGNTHLPTSLLETFWGAFRQHVSWT